MNDFSTPAQKSGFCNRGNARGRAGNWRNAHHWTNALDPRPRHLLLTANHLAFTMPTPQPPREIPSRVNRSITSFSREYSFLSDTAWLIEENISSVCRPRRPAGPPSA